MPARPGRYQGLTAVNLRGIDGRDAVAAAGPA